MPSASSTPSNASACALVSWNPCVASVANTGPWIVAGAMPLTLRVVLTSRDLSDLDPRSGLGRLGQDSILRRMGPTDSEKREDSESAIQKTVIQNGFRRMRVLCARPSSDGIRAQAILHILDRSPAMQWPDSRKQWEPTVCTAKHDESQGVQWRPSQLTQRRGPDQAASWSCMAALQVAFCLPMPPSRCARAGLQASFENCAFSCLAQDYTRISPSLQILSS